MYEEGNRFAGNNSNNGNSGNNGNNGNNGGNEFADDFGDMDDIFAEIDADALIGANGAAPPAPAAPEPVGALSPGEAGVGDRGQPGAEPRPMSGEAAAGEDAPEGEAAAVVADPTEDRPAVGSPRTHSEASEPEEGGDGDGGEAGSDQPASKRQRTTPPPSYVEATAGAGDEA